MNKLYLILTASFLSFNSTYSLLQHHNQLQKMVSIKNSSKLKESATAIASKIKTGTVLHLKGFCQNQAMDTSKVTTEIRKTLVGYELLSKLEAQYVVPEHLMLTGNNKYQLQVIKDGLTAKTVPIAFIVEKSAVIIP